MFPIFAGNSASTGYNLTRSVRTRAGSNVFFARSPASAGNRQTFTISKWVKRGALGVSAYLMGAEPVNGASGSYLYFTNSDTLQFYDYASGVYQFQLITTQVFRDPSAWYHIVVVSDTTQATAANRLKIYVNGVQITAFGTATYPSQNYSNSSINNTVPQYIGYTSSTFDGYRTEYNFIDGQALTPASFGTANALTGVWQPAAYTSTYGTTGFFLQFKDPTSAISLGYDSIPATRITSGSGNYTIPAYSTSLVVELWGAGGGGAGTSPGGVAATAGTGGATTFSTLTASGGLGGTGAWDSVVNGSAGVGGAAAGGDVNITGNTGYTNYYTGAISGANAPNGGIGGLVNVAASTVGPGGGGGSGGNPSTAAGGAGGSGGYVKKTYAPGAISGSIAYSIGTAGTAGAGGSYNGNAGANGAIRITVDGVRVDNDWYPRNISVAAGVTYDSMTDVPTLTSATAANYCVMNPLDINSSLTISGGNLNAISDATAAWRSGAMTFGNFTTGKWYYEVTANSIGASTYVSAGWELTTINHTTQVSGVGAATGNNFGVLINNALRQTKVNSATFSSDSNANANGDVLMIAVDFDAGKGWVGKNGTWYDSGNPSTGTNPCTTTVSGGMTPAFQAYNAGSLSFNAGQRAFSYTPPTGFVALCTYNLPTSTILQGNKVMDATLYTGNGGTITVANAAAFKPDLVWTKSRSTSSTNHLLTNSITGNGVSLQSNNTGAEGTRGSTITSTGFSYTYPNEGGDGNFSGQTYVGWQWQAGQGTTSSNTNGSITSTVSVNASAGFSVVTATSPASGNPFTLGHGLGVAPAFIISKSRSGSGNWSQYHVSTGAGGYLTFTTGAFTANTDTWNNTAPTSSVISTTTNWWGFSSTLVFYCWTPIAGFSAFGSLTGNGSADGVFVYLGFKPRFILYKRTDSTSDWRIWDTARTPYNAMSSVLYPNVSDAEFTASSQDFDALSNGFKIRNSSAAMNASGGTYIYAAFASNPFRNSLAQ